mmetsp:Transcript_41766/g.50647  ORF Transcript_41766/g.50647 Transcript_41766/m.50647 type:complete len:85 (+) Transcript_41766:172-426(+)
MGSGVSVSKPKDKQTTGTNPAKDGTVNEARVVTLSATAEANLRKMEGNGASPNNSGQLMRRPRSRSGETEADGDLPPPPASAWG